MANPSLQPSDKILRTVRELAQRSTAGETCYYLYDLDRVRRQIQMLKTHLPEQCLVYYAVKANPHPAILEELRRHDYIRGVEIASQGELRACEEYFVPQEIIFTGPAKTLSELRLAVKRGIRQIHIESLQEIERLVHGAMDPADPPQDILVRLNVNYSFTGMASPLAAQMAGQPSKFGIDEDAFPAVAETLREHARLNLKGVHVFGGSGILNADDFLAFVQYCFTLIDSCDEIVAGLDRIDLGGGFGIDYRLAHGELDLARIGAGLRNLIQKHGFQDRELILELGRYLVGECGYYLAPIVDIKESRGKKFILTAGGFNHFRRFHDHGINHPTLVLPGPQSPYLSQATTVSHEQVDIGGPLCTPRDFIARDLYVEKARIGDFVLIGMAGAYGLTSSPVNFLSHPLPEQLFV